MKMCEEPAYAVLESPIGPLLLSGTDAGLNAIEFARNGRPALPAAGWREDRNAMAEPLRQLAAYFAGELRQFDLPLAPRGTAFQLAVWRELQGIPFGETISYAELARRIGQPRAVRAVGSANGRNPLPVVIPCHRVIGSDGRLTGYAGGLDLKRRLLALEGCRLPG
jgi:methylated-DNA-[protein]-cysteine S-methyltransferase